MGDRLTTGSSTTTPDATGLETTSNFAKAGVELSTAGAIASGVATATSGTAGASGSTGERKLFNRGRMRPASPSVSRAAWPEDG